jgi:hypothetical protein
VRQGKGTAIIRGLLWTMTPVLLYACGEIGGSGQCGGVEDSGACVVIEEIQPTYEVSGGDVSNVDAFMDICEVTEDGEFEFEEITDHDAIVTISNLPLPGSTVTFVPDVTFTRYTIEYSPNFCPNGICPPLTSVSASETIFVPGFGSVSRDLKMVDLAKKMEYAAGVGDNLFPSLVGAPHTPNSLLFPSYTARYTFTGKDIFNNGIVVSGVTEFTIGDYANCN